jgi:hypothetical protein
MLRRETIIALRARHSAFRMAIDILYPQQSPPEIPTHLPLPAEPTFKWVAYDPAGVQRIRRQFEAAEQRRERRRALSIVFLATLGLLWIGYMMWTLEVDAPSQPLPATLNVQDAPAPPRRP